MSVPRLAFCVRAWLEGRYVMFGYAAAVLGLWLAMACPVAEAQSPRPDAPKPDVPIKFELDVDVKHAQRTQIEVLEPDGSRATEAKYFAGRRYDRFALDESFDTVQPAGIRFGNVPQGQETDLGFIPVPLDPKAEVISVWSKRGFHQLVPSQLRRMHSIPLEPWAKLQVKLMTDEGPDAGAPMDVVTNRTSDNQFGGASFVWNGNADQDGFVTVPYFPPGRAMIRINTRLESRGNATWETAERQLSVHVSPGQALTLELGGTGRSIQGEVMFPEDADTDDVSDLTGMVEHTATGETVYFQFNPDGSFESPSLPFGAGSVRIESLSRGRGKEKPWVGELKFECESGSSAPQSVGKIQLRYMNTHEADHERVQDPTKTDSELRANTPTTQRVALVAGAKRGNTVRYVLIDAEGKEVPVATELRAQVGWGSQSNHVAMDVDRERIYLIAQAHEGTNMVLCTLDMSGQILASRELETTGNYRVAVNRQTGDVWLLLVRQVGSASVEVFDVQGRSKNEFPCDAFTLCYSQVDDAMWMVGDKYVHKCDTRSGDVIASWEIPLRIWTLTAAIPDPMGGILCFESQHPDVPDSSNRLYRIDSNAEQAVCSDLGNCRINGMAFLGNEIWATGVAIDRIDAKEPTIQRVSWAFDRGLNFLADRQLGIELVAPASDSARVWCIQDGSLQMRTTGADGEAPVTLDAPLRDVGVLWTDGN